LELSTLFITDANWLQAHPSIFILGFPLFWCLTTFLIGAFSGWLILARKFRAENDFAGEKFCFSSAYMRFFSHYGNILTFGANSSGLYMSIFALFRAGHPPLLIPWSEIKVIQGESSFLLKRRRLVLGREESIPLSISHSLTEHLKRAAGPAWPIESLGA
jgi:hypothetical protein